MKSAYSNMMIVIDPTTQEQAALTRGIALSGDDAEVSLFYCTYAGGVELELAESRMELKRTTIKEGKNHLNAITDAHGISERNISKDVLWNADWHRMLVFSAAKMSADLVVKSKSPSTGVISKFRSSDRYLVRNASCPTLFVDGTGEGKYERVVASIVLEKGDEHHMRLNHGVIAHAKKLAATTGAELHILSAFERQLNLDMLSTHIGENDIAQQISDDYGVEVDRVHIIQDAAAHAMTSFTNGSDCLVMGSCARKGVTGELLGNTAEAVLRKADCDILVVP